MLNSLIPTHLWKRIQLEEREVPLRVGVLGERPLGRVQRVLHEEGDGHGANAAGHGGDGGGALGGLIELNIADKTVA